ncbi:hypothetical protein ACTVH1_17630 [Gluconobacter cerinus]
MLNVATQPRVISRVALARLKSFLAPGLKYGSLSARFVAPLVMALAVNTDAPRPDVAPAVMDRTPAVVLPPAQAPPDAGERDTTPTVPGRSVSDFQSTAETARVSEEKPADRPGEQAEQVMRAVERQTITLAPPPPPMDDPVPEKALVRAVERASARTGLRPEFLLAISWMESRFARKARAMGHVSTATGAFQFTEDGWLEAIRRFGEHHGLGVLASHIHKNARTGKLDVAPAVRRQALALRNNQSVSAAMAAESCLDVERRPGISQQAYETDMYLHHVLGTGGLDHFLKVLQARPSRSVEVALPVKVIRNNRGLFMKDGKPLSVSESYHHLLAVMTERSMHMEQHLGKSPDEVAENRFTDGERIPKP